MRYLKRSLSILLLLFLCACTTSRQEPTPVRVEPTAIEVSETPTEAPQPTEPAATKTIQPTMPPTAISVSQVRSIYNAVNIRSGPGEDFAEIALLYQGETAILVGTNEYGDWYEIRTEDGREGWVAASVVEVTQSQIAAVETPAVNPEVTGDSGTPQIRVTVNSANVRSGPGENYPVIDTISQGSTVTVRGYAHDGTWFNIQLADGSRGWIGAVVTEPVGEWGLEAISEVEAVPAPPDSTNPSTGTTGPVAVTQSPPTLASPTEPPPPSPANVQITYINYDGAVYRVESDEYAVITNKGGQSINLAGWRLNAGDPGQDFIFPSYELQPGQSCRVYTNENHPETCGFSFGSGRAIWNNDGDRGYLYNASGIEVSRLFY